MSAPLKLPPGGAVTGIAWDAALPPKTWVRAQLRLARTEEELGRAPWRGPAGEGSWFESDQPAPADAFRGRWVQYRLALGAVNGGNTPRVTEVRVSYRA